MLNSAQVLFFTDFEKAFDSIDHKYIINCLKPFIFGVDFIKMLQLFYKDAKSCVSNNRYLSDFFSTFRGVCQGCPRSTYLFITCIELFSYTITTTEDMKGITYSKPEFKNSLFADDASFILDGSIKLLEALVYVLDNGAPLVADLFLFCYDRDFMMSLSNDKQADVIDAFNITSRYLDDILKY